MKNTLYYKEAVYNLNKEIEEAEKIDKEDTKSRVRASLRIAIRLSVVAFLEKYEEPLLLN